MEKVTLLIPDLSVRKSTLRLTVPRFLITLVIAVCCIAMIFAAKNLFLLSEIAVVKALDRYEALKSRHLEKELLFVEKMAGKFEKDVNAIFCFDDHIRLLFGLKLVHQDIREVGIGGPDIGNTDIHLLDDGREQNVRELKSTIDKLLRQAELEISSITA